MHSEKWDHRFLDVARLVASWSKDPSTKTGAVLVRSDKSIASVGFNGFPKTMLDDAATYADREKKYSRIVHCEINAAIHAGGPIAGCTLYTWPFLSCDRCCVQMIQSGIVRLVAPKPTPDQETRWGKAFALTREYCREAGVHVTEYDREDGLSLMDFVNWEGYEAAMLKLGAGADM